MPDLRNSKESTPLNICGRVGGQNLAKELLKHQLYGGGMEEKFRMVLPLVDKHNEAGWNWEELEEKFRILI